MTTKPSDLPSVEISPGPLPDRQRRFRLRFSLLTLMAIALVACIVAAFYGTRQRELAAARQIQVLRANAKQQEEQIARLRAELGHLTIADKDKVHLLRLATRNEQHWKWRVYLPPQRQWKLYGGVGKVPITGLDGISFGMSSVEGGEFTLEVYVEKDRDGQPRLVYGTPTTTSRIGIPETEFQRMTSSAVGWQSGGSSGTVEQFPPGAPIELLRLRVHEEVEGPDGSRTFRTSQQPQFGFLIWIEEAKPGE